jgi:hypothetical protein
MGPARNLRGDASGYRIRGAIWELGSFSYRAYVHLVPAVARADLLWSVVSVGGVTLQEVFDAVMARLRATVGIPLEKLEALAWATPKQD